MITFHSFQLESLNLDQKCILVRLRSLFSHSELKCARPHVGHVYFRRNFRLGPPSHLNELSKLPSQQLGSPGYYDRCHFERNDLICYSQYHQTFCHVKQTSHLIIFDKSGRLFYWAIIEVRTKSWQWKYILACCHCYWCRFFVIRVPNRYYIVEKCCYMCIFMLPIVHGLQLANTKWTLCNLGWIFFFLLHSAVIWISQLNFFFINISFLTQIVQQLSRESAAFSVYMINCSYFVFVADGFLNHSQFWMEQKRMHVKPDLCGNPTRKQIVPVSILITVNSRLGHGSAFWSLWTHSDLSKRSMWAHSELLIFFSWVIMKMISYQIKGFVTDNVELKSVFFIYILICMFSNWYILIYWVVIAYPVCFQFFIFSFIKFLPMDMILCSHVCATYTVT